MRRFIIIANVRGVFIGVSIFLTESVRGFVLVLSNIYLLMMLTQVVTSNVVLLFSWHSSYHVNLSLDDLEPDFESPPSLLKHLLLLADRCLLPMYRLLQPLHCPQEHLSQPDDLPRLLQRIIILLLIELYLLHIDPLPGPLS